ISNTRAINTLSPGPILCVVRTPRLLSPPHGVLPGVKHTGPDPPVRRPSPRRAACYRRASAMQPPSSTSFVPSEAWRVPLARVGRGTLLVVGAPGRGKSGLASWLLGQLQRALGRVALISADPGQASIGVP